MRADAAAKARAACECPRIGEMARVAPAALPAPQTWWARGACARTRRREGSAPRIYSCCPCVDFDFRNALPASRIRWRVPTVLFFFGDFFWIQLCLDTGYDRAFGALLWRFSPAWDAVELTLEVGLVCPFVVIDNTDIGSTIVVAEALCLTV